MPANLQKAKTQTTLDSDMNNGHFTYVSPDPVNKHATEIEEETKEESAAENNEELFKHLSYLSQLSNDVQKH